MYWTEVKRALLYGQPAIREDKLQPQPLKTAIRDISRLIGVGWIDELTDDAIQRIQKACQANQCPEVWDEFQYENPLLHRKRRKRGDKKRSSSKRAKITR